MKTIKATDPIEEGKALGHIPDFQSEYMTDRIECSCGWKSFCFFDGMSYAFSDWKKHINKVKETNQIEMNFGP